jgi:hypothetical protein
MKKTKILVLGNDPQINSIEFNRLDPGIITLGVNRIWLKHIPNFFFFNDCEIIDELNLVPETLAKLRSCSTIFSSDWLRYGAKRRGTNLPSWTRVIDRTQLNTFADSVSTSISIFHRHFLKSSDYTFYVAGVSLLWQEPSHFWKSIEYSNAKNKNDREWYDPRFNRIETNFRNLKNLGINIISVNPNSRLNKIFRYENIGNLYSK